MTLTVLCCCSVSAMVRLEGLVKGGAAGEYEGCFMEHLRMLKDPLLDQMVDRCSATAASAGNSSMCSKSTAAETAAEQKHRCCGCQVYLMGLACQGLMCVAVRIDHLS